MHVIRWLCGALVLAAGSAGAAPPGDSGWTPVGADVLDSARGGFAGGDGLALSFGIERMVSLNGTVLMRTSVRLADLGHLTAEQARQTGETLSAVKLIQAGSDNIYLRPMQEQMQGAIVIQNSLSNQAIRSDTVINASTNSMALLQSLNFGRSLADALAGAASPH